MSAGQQEGLMNLIAITTAAVAFGFWQHSTLAGVFVFAALYVLMPYAEVA